MQNDYVPFKYKILEYLIEHGADINKKFQHFNSKYTPLGYLCKQSDPDIELIKFLIDHGADIHKKCKVERKLLSKKYIEHSSLYYLRKNDICKNESDLYNLVISNLEEEKEEEDYQEEEEEDDENESFSWD